MNDFYYRKLDAYQLAKELVMKVYVLLRKYPEEERFALCDQIRRSVISIPSNIAEGMGRMAIKDRIRFIDIAYGSLTECVCQLEISLTLNYITQAEFDEIEVLAQRVSMTLIGLKKNLTDKINNSINQ